MWKRLMGPLFVVALLAACGEDAPPEQPAAVDQSPPAATEPRTSEPPAPATEPAPGRSDSETPRTTPN